MRLLVRLERLLRPLIHFAHRRLRGGTLGVRGVVWNADGQVLLIEHTYIEGWHLPGGGVERGEAAEQAVARELEEEAGVRLLDRPRLVSVHCNHRNFRGDQVLVYWAGAWEDCPPTSRGEIRRRGWFSPDELPDGVTAATRARIAEALGRASDPLW